MIYYFANVNLIRIKFIAAAGKCDELLYRAEFLHKAAASEDFFVLLFSQPGWQDSFTITCAPGTARAVLAAVVNGTLSDLISGTGSIVDIKLGTFPQP